MPYAPNVLVADDDRGIQLYLRRKLSAEGYAVITVDTAQAALAWIGQQPPDAVILGTNLPDSPALAAIRAVRSISAVSVLGLLDDEGEAAVAALLDGGADQCLLKPFSLDEVLAWLRTTLRRRGLIVNAAGLEMDIARGQINRQGQETKLSLRQRQVLRVLAESDGAVVSSPEILRRVWGLPGARGARSLRQAIHGLRQMIEPDPSTPAFILTEARVGYRFRAHRVARGSVSDAARRQGAKHDG